MIRTRKIYIRSELKFVACLNEFQRQYFNICSQIHATTHKPFSSTTLRSLRRIFMIPRAQNLVSLSPMNSSKWLLQSSQSTKVPPILQRLRLVLIQRCKFRWLWQMKSDILIKLYQFLLVLQRDVKSNFVMKTTHLIG